MQKIKELLQTISCTSNHVSKTNHDIDSVIVSLSNQIILPSSILRDPKYIGESKEGKVQNNILKQLQVIYGAENVQKEYSIGGYWGMRSDLDLFDGKIGIELKIAEQLKKATNVERLIGQTIYYTKRKYSYGNLIVLVGGKEKEYDASMREIENIINSIGGHFIYYKVN